MRGGKRGREEERKREGANELLCGGVRREVRLVLKHLGF
jgi:hypothetical protein